MMMIGRTFSAPRTPVG